MSKEFFCHWKNAYEVVQRRRHGDYVKLVNYDQNYASRENTALPHHHLNYLWRGHGGIVGNTLTS